MDLIKVLSNPIRVQVVQYLQAYGASTTKQIAAALDDVPAPTLYRHIHALLEEKVLLVQEERKVRGSLERLLALNKEVFTETENKDLAETAYQFLMALYAKFKTYSNKPDADPKRDRLSLRTRILSLSDEEFDRFLQEMAALMDRYEQAAWVPNRKKRSFSFLSSPVEEEVP